MHWRITFMATQKTNKIKNNCIMLLFKKKFMATQKPNKIIVSIIVIVKNHVCIKKK